MKCEEFAVAELIYEPKNIVVVILAFPELVTDFFLLRYHLLTEVSSVY